MEISGFLVLEGFTRLSLSAELRKVKSPAELRGGVAPTTKLTRLSNLEKYKQRGRELPPKDRTQRAVKSSTIVDGGRRGAFAPVDGIGAASCG